MITEFLVKSDNTKFLMIRVPFFPMSRGRVGQAPSLGAPSSYSPTAEEDRIEARLSSLERRLVTHAEELNQQVCHRVMRIQSRLERAMRPFQPESERQRTERSADNVVEFGREVAVEESPVDHQLHLRNARAAMKELNETLRLTREHLEALSGSIERMRRSVSDR